MSIHDFLQKISNLCEILQLPSGFSLKRTEPAFDFAVLRLCARLKDAGVIPNVVFDVGANTGQFALSATTVWPGAVIFSYEPVASSFGKLQNLSNRYPKIHPISAALGKMPGKEPIHVTSQPQSSSFLELHENHKGAYPHVVEQAVEVVDVRTLAEEVSRLAPGTPALLKLDVQGFESEVIRGGMGALGVFQWVVLETSTRPMYEGEVLFDDIKSQLSDQGFRFETPLEIHFAANGAPAQFDALFKKI